MSIDQFCQLRLRAQRLYLPSNAPRASVAEMVQQLCAVQAQEAPSAALAIRARSRGLVAADVERARVEERSIIRTWGLRSTLHLLPTQDIGWLLPLVGPVFVAQSARRRQALGLDDELYARSLHLVQDILAAQGPLTRADLIAQLAARDIQITGQARPHLLGRAALEGVLCLGPYQGSEPTYVLLSDWVDPLHTRQNFSEQAAYAELSRRYLSAYGPATPQDQATWSGLPLSKTRTAWQSIAGELLEVAVAGATAWMLKANAAWLNELNPSEPITRLLPRFDVYLLGYQNRDFAVPPAFAKRINAGGGILHPVLLVDGIAAGIWKSLVRKKDLTVRVEPFAGLAPQVERGLQAEVLDLARFLNVQARLEIATRG